MPDYNFERECRTPHSECYVIEADDDEIGRVDIHYTPTAAYATLCVPDTLSEDDVQALITEIDERLVMSNDPYREDFVVTVWAGHETGVYSEEEPFEEEEEEEEEEESGGNGYRD
ncbi:MAG: hypothetical protein QME71_07975 [Dehalococcoidia bacterium]|nr:hypothetical protein [Dehalococcoidia bacterium]